jgi:hypothetical protein
VANGGLRKDLTPQELVDEVEESTEGLPEASTVPRLFANAPAGGELHLAGEEPYEEATASEAQLVAPDPPLHVDATEPDQA